jgi:hypothetical protein
MDALPSRIYTVEFILSLENKYQDRILQSEVINKFVDEYKSIISQDAINPIFSLTSQYSKFPNSKIKKFKKFNNNLYIKNKDAWVPYGKVDEDKLLLHSIKVILNKISHQNYNVLYEELLGKLSQYTDVKILDILSIEFYQKAIQDVNFQPIYLDICHKLWSNYEWQDNLYSILVPDEEDHKYYWYPNNNLIESPGLKGPYKSENDLREQVRKVLGFKVSFLNYLQEQYNKRPEYISEIKDKGEYNDELRYKLRRHIFGPIEIIGKLYWKKYIPQSIVHVMILSLLSYQEDELPIEEDIEGLSILWNIIDNEKNIPFKPVLIEQYFKIIEKIEKTAHYSTRIKFLIQNMVKKYHDKYNEKTPIRSPTPHNMPLKSNTANMSSEDIINRYLKKGNLDEAIDSIINMEQKDELVDTILYLVCENPKNQVSLFNLWQKLKDKKYFLNVDLQKLITIFMDNINDIEIDCPNATITITNFIELINK